MTLDYKINGLLAYILSITLFIGLSFAQGLVSPTIIYDNHSGLLVATQIYGTLLAIFCYIKAHYFPSFS